MPQRDGKHVVLLPRVLRRGWWLVLADDIGETINGACVVIEKDAIIPVAVIRTGSLANERWNEGARRTTRLVRAIV